MKVLSIFRRIWYFLRRRQLERELQEEIAFHRERIGERLERDGHSPAEAAAAAARSMGNVTLAREDARDLWSVRWLQSARQDLQYASRSLRRQPGFAAIVICTLGVAVGLNTCVATMFSAMYVRPWPVADADSVFELLLRDKRGATHSVMEAEFRTLSDAIRLSTPIAATCGGSGRPTDCAATLASDQRVTLQFVDGQYFSTLGLDMALGRGFLPEDDRSSAAPVAIVSTWLWQQAFGSSPDAIGTQLVVDGTAVTIVGVAGGFTGTSLLRRDIWVPLASARVMRPATAGTSTPVDLAVRLKPSISLAQAEAEMRAIYRAISPARELEVTLVRTSAFSRPGDRTEGYVVFAALSVGVLLILLLACANVGNLLLARTLARRREMAVRAAIGASRFRLVRQLLTESMVLSVLAASAGVWMAFYLPTIVIDLGMQASDAQGRLAFPVTPDWPIFAYTAALAIVTCLAFALAPALHACGPDLNTAIKDPDVTSLGRGSLRSIVLGTQVSVSVVLLAVAALLTRSVEHAKTIDLGFDVDGVVALSFDLPPSYDDDRRARVRRGLLAGISALHSETLTAFASSAPLSDGPGTRVRPPGVDEGDDLPADLTAVSKSYFELLGLEFVAGRRLQEGDRDGSIVVNETLASRLWPGESAIGRELILGRGADAAIRRVVGVVRNASIDGEALYMAKVRPRAFELLTAGSMLRTDTGFPQVLVSARLPDAIATITRAAGAVDSHLRVRSAPLADTRDERLSEARLTGRLAGVLGLTALVLATVGVLGVFGLLVRQQTREIAIRMAMGAQRRQILRAVVALGARPMLTGLGVGTAAALTIAELLRSSLFGLSPFTPVVYVQVAAVLLGASIVALAVPAARALRIDPLVGLRSE